MRLSEHPLLKPHVGKPAILDSNLLLFSWCSDFHPALVSKFKRLSSFQIEDVDLLSETLKVFPVLKTTPHVLTEVSNLANQLPSWLKEDWIPAATIAHNELFWLGLTDAGLAQLASTHVILTIDFPLSNSLESRGLNVINFTHLRS